MIDQFTIFTGLALFTLAWFTYSDIKKGTVDGRRNSYMSGAVIALMLLDPVGRIIPYFGAVAVTLVIGILVSRRIGLGDTRAFYWLIPGFAIFNFQYAILFFILVVGINTGVFGVIRLLKLKHERTPFFPIITGAFLATTYLIGLMA